MSICSELNRTEYHNQQISTNAFWFASFGCALLESLPPLCCVRAKDRSWRLHLGVEVETPCLGFRGSEFRNPELGFVLGGLDFIMVAEPCGATHTIVR